jgi:signal transduction histidine kinase
VIVLNAVPVAVNLWKYPDEVLAGPLPVALIVIAFSLLFGAWAHRIINQSRDRAALIEELAATRAEVARLSRLAGAAAERERLAAEIHDTLAQGFISIVTLLQAADAELGEAPSKARRQLALAVRTARENLAEARSLVASLPAPLQASSLEDALHRLAAGLAEEQGIDARCVIEGTARPLPAAVEVVLLRATQEALANVRKHAAAGVVTVRLTYAGERVRLEVTDDGTGFAPELVPAARGEEAGTARGAMVGAAGDAVTGNGFGLPAMRTRVQQVGGDFAVRAAPGQGTRLTVEVPL